MSYVVRGHFSSDGRIKFIKRKTINFSRSWKSTGRYLTLITSGSNFQIKTNSSTYENLPMNNKGTWLFAKKNKTCIDILFWILITNWIKQLTIFILNFRFLSNTKWSVSNEWACFHTAKNKRIRTGTIFCSHPAPVPKSRSYTHPGIYRGFY